MTIPDDLLNARIADALVENGYAVIADFMSPLAVSAMRDALCALKSTHSMRRAGVGKGAELALKDEIRGDFVHWIYSDDSSGDCATYLTKLEALRQALNQTLMLGLFEFEGHFACYPAGAFYRRHLDQFKEDNHRTLTCILYLNADWDADDGGQLRMYLNHDDPEEFIDIPPSGGTLVAFLSSRFWHEVLPARRERLSLTGWFKTRS